MAKRTAKELLEEHKAKQKAHPKQRKPTARSKKAAVAAATGIGLMDDDLAKLDADAVAKAEALEAADREYSKRNRGNGNGRQALITLPDVDRKIETQTFEVYRDIETELIFRRRQLGPDEPDKLTDANMDTDKKLNEAQKLATIAKALKGSKWSGRTAESVAPRILKALTGDRAKAVDVTDEEVDIVVWRCSFWTLKDREEAWAGEKGRKPKWQAQLQKARIKGLAGAEKREEIVGNVRIFVQDRMKKQKKVIVDGELFEAAYGALFKRVYREVNPDDDKDPKNSAPADEWLRAALPDKAPA